MSGGSLPWYGGDEVSTAQAAAAAGPWIHRAAGMRMGARKSSALSSRAGSVEHARCLFQGGVGDDAAAAAAAAAAEVAAAAAETAPSGTPTASASSRLRLGEEECGDSTAVAHEYLRDFLGMTDEVWFGRMFRRFGAEVWLPQYGGLSSAASRYKAVDIPWRYWGNALIDRRE